MPRPRLSSDEKLVPATVCLPPALFDELSREASGRVIPLARVLRERIERSFANAKPARDRNALG